MTIRPAFCDFLTEAARRVDLTGNSLVTLDDLTHALLVEQGAVDLFAVRLAGGHPAGRWIPLGRAPAGAVLVAPPGAAPRGIVGRAGPDAVLSRVPMGRLCDLSSAAPDALPSAEATTAARQLVQGIEAGMSAIAAVAPLASDDRALVPDPATARPADAVRWVQAELVQLLDAVNSDAARRQTEERAALAARARQQSAAVRAVARSFDAVVQGGAAGGGRLADVAADPPALAAVRLVASVLGFSVRAPAGREVARTAIDPVQLIALANGFRTRQVKLDGRWWKKDIGPLLGRRKTDGRVLALLPARGSYVVADPAAKSETRLTEAAAAEFDQGTVLYRPLPEGVRRPGALLRFAISGARADLLRIGWTGLSSRPSACSPPS